MGNQENKSKQDYKYFAARLVDNEYVLSEQDYISTNIVFSSEWIHPTLDKVGNVNFKLFYLSNILSNELAKFGHKITSAKIKERVILKDITVYHSRDFDEEANRDVDYFYIIDAIKFRAFVYKRFADLTDIGNGFKKFGKEKRTVLKTNEVSVDDFFNSAVGFSGDHIHSFELKNEVDLVKEIKENNLKLLLFTDNHKKLDYIQEKCEIDVDIKKVNNFEIKIISSDRPLIETGVEITLSSSDKTFYSVSGEIIKQKTVSHKKFYAHNILVDFKSPDKIQSVKAIFIYIKNLKLDNFKK